MVNITAVRLFECLLILIFISGCMKDASRTPPAGDYTDSAYFRAEGTGQSESEARNQAVAEMSRIFESSVFSDTYDRASEIIDSSGSGTYRGRVESNIRVISAVKLKGVRIDRTWFDREKSNYHAVAVLDRNQAADEWQDGIEAIDHRIAAEMRTADTMKSKFMKLLAYMKTVDLWVEREVLVSRLRVIGFPDPVAGTYDIKEAFYMIPRLKAGIRIYLDISGEYAGRIESKLAESLNTSGFILNENRDNADVLITGDLEVLPVELNNPGWAFARASVALTLNDTATNATLGEVSESARAGHLNYEEAVHKAVNKVAAEVIESIVGKLTE